MRQGSVRSPRAILILAGFAARYLLRARLRFVVTLAGVTMAVFLICLQLSLLIGFRRAAAQMITAADAQAWIMPIGVPCFEFGATIAERHRDTAAGVSGVTGIAAIATGFATFVREDGERRAVLVVGGDRNVGGTFPAVDGLDPFPNHQQAWIPQSNAKILGVSARVPASKSAVSRSSCRGVGQSRLQLANRAIGVDRGIDADSEEARVGQQSATTVMSLLTKVSADKVVVVVSHDSRVWKYASHFVNLISGAVAPHALATGGGLS